MDSCYTIIKCGASGRLGDTPTIPCLLNKIETHTTHAQHIWECTFVYVACSLLTVLVGIFRRTAASTSRAQAQLEGKLTNECYRSARYPIHVALRESPYSLLKRRYMFSPESRSRHLAGVAKTMTPSLPSCGEANMANFHSLPEDGH